MRLVLRLPVRMAATGRRSQAAVSAARPRTKVWPSAPCDSLGCSGTLSPEGRPVLQSSAKVPAAGSSLIQLRQQGGRYSRAKRTGARRTEGSPPQGADERALLSKFTISSGLDVTRQGCDSAIQNHMKAFDHSAFIPILELCSCKQHRHWDNLASLPTALSLYKSDAQSAYV